MDLQARLLPQGRARTPACAQAQDQPARNSGPHRPGGDRGRSRWGGRHDGCQISGGRQEVRGFIFYFHLACLPFRAFACVKPRAVLVAFVVSSCLVGLLLRETEMEIYIYGRWKLILGPM